MQGVPAIDPAQRDLAAGEQGPEQHAGGFAALPFGSAQGSRHLIRRLNSSCSRSMALVVRIDFHWSGG